MSDRNKAREAEKVEADKVTAEMMIVSMLGPAQRARVLAHLDAEALKKKEEEMRVAVDSQKRERERLAAEA